MNRSLVIPAGVCLLAFAALLAALHGAKGRETSANPTHLGAAWHRGGGSPMPGSRANSPLPAPHAIGDQALPINEAHQILTTLAGAYMRPWQEWEASPRHLYSRAAPRPIPTISARIEIATSELGPSDSLVVATIAVSTGAQSEQVPCVVDRVTKRVKLYAKGQWLTEDQWLTNAPRP